MSQFSFFVISSVLLCSGCGFRIGPASTFELKKQDSVKTNVTPKISDAQLRMIESPDSTLSKLGWSALAANLRLGARPSDAQINRLNILWEKQKDLPIATHIMNLLKNPSFQDDQMLIQSLSPEKAINDPNFLKLVNSTSPIDQEVVSQLDPSYFKSTYDYSQFLENSEPSPFQQGSLAPFRLDSTTPTEWVRTTPSTQFAITPGVLDVRQKTVLTGDMRRSDGGNVHQVWTYTAHPPVVVNLEQLSKEPFLVSNVIRLDALNSIFKKTDDPQTARCLLIRQNLQINIQGGYQGNGITNQNNVETFTCMSLHLADNPPVASGRATRYQVGILSSSRLTPIGSYNLNAPPAPTFSKFLPWFTVDPSVTAMIEQPTNASHPWVGVRLSRKLMDHADLNGYLPQYPSTLAHVRCESGCLYPDPITQTSDGELIFAQNGLGTIKLSVQIPMPFAFNFETKQLIDFNIDVIEENTVPFANVLDASELPKRTEAATADGANPLLALWSSALQVGGWQIPSLAREEASMPVSLYRLSMMNDLIGSNFGTLIQNANSLEFKMSILAAYSRNAIPAFERTFHEKAQLNELLSQIDQKLTTATQHLNSLSTDESYALLGYSSNALKISNPQIILDKEELSQSILGAWELIHEELLRTQASLKILCDGFSKMRLSSPVSGSEFLRTAQPEVLEQCENQK